MKLAVVDRGHGQWRASGFCSPADTCAIIQPGRQHDSSMRQDLYQKDHGRMIEERGECGSAINAMLARSAHKCRATRDAEIGVIRTMTMES